jgi:hypothetical protein
MSSFSVLSATILSASSGRGLASFYGAHPYIALFMGRQDGGHGFGWMGSTTALAMSWEKKCGRSSTVVALMAAVAVAVRS